MKRLLSRPFWALFTEKSLTRNDSSDVTDFFRLCFWQIVGNIVCVDGQKKKEKSLSVRRVLGGHFTISRQIICANMENEKAVVSRNNSIT